MIQNEGISIYPITVFSTRSIVLQNLLLGLRNQLKINSSSWRQTSTFPHHIMYQ